MELLRSLQFVPGNRRNMLEKARGFQADVLVADLEDSVPPEEKSTARDLVAELVPTLSQRGQKVMVRVNSLDTGRTAEELRAVVSPQLYGVSLGKVDSPWHVTECHRLLSVEEARRGMPLGTVKIIPWIESAAGVLSASAISAASRRVVALAFGAEDFTNDMGLQRTESGEEVAFPRSLVPIAARAAGIVALDTPYVRFRDCGRAAKRGGIGRQPWDTRGSLPFIPPSWRPSTPCLRQGRRTWSTPGGWLRRGKSPRPRVGARWPWTGTWWTYRL